MDRTCAEHPDRNAAGFCVKCGKALCEDCAQKISGRSFCAGCLSEDLRSAREGGGGRDAAPGRRPSGRDRITPSRPKRSRQKFSVTVQELRRIVAIVIDSVLLIVVSVPLSWMLMQLTVLMYREVQGIGYNLSFYMVLTMLSSVYFIVSHWRYGKTIGKFLMGIRVVGYAGEDRITFMQSFWRWTGFLTGVIWAYAGYWIASRALGWVVVFKDKIPNYILTLAVAAGVVFTGFFSLGLLITFIGKYKRGFHDLLGATIVRLDRSSERRS